VDAVEMADERPVVDPNWCIGCGVCAVSCPADVISIKRRLENRPPNTFADLHHRIRQEKQKAD
jgi:Fe-S-cluster-containing hydrogenase component 2